MPSKPLSIPPTTTLSYFSQSVREILLITSLLNVNLYFEWSFLIRSNTQRTTEQRKDLSGIESSLKMCMLCIVFKVRKNPDATLLDQDPGSPSELWLKRALQVSTGNITKILLFT